MKVEFNNRKKQLMKNSLWCYHDRLPGHELLVNSHQQSSGGGHAGSNNGGGASAGSTGGRDDDNGSSSIAPRVLLEDRDLWEKFHILTNEMIVTKCGRY